MPQSVSLKFISLSGELENWLSVSGCSGFEKLTAMKAYRFAPVTSAAIGGA
jgi:hypothetical protein